MLRQSKLQSRKKKDKSNADKLPDVNVNKVGAQMGDYGIKIKKMLDDY